MIGWSDLVVALGLAAFLEGALYAVFPAQAKAVWETISGMSENRLRMIGLVAALGGVFIVWLVRGA